MNMVISHGNYINGIWRKGSGEHFVSLNPANGEVIWQGSAADASDVAEAVADARAAFPAWAALPVAARMGVIERFGKEVESIRDDLAVAVSREMGKTLWDSRAEIGAVIGKIAISLEAYRERTGLKMSENNGVRTVLRHKPHGVMAVFGPYNFPAHLPNGHMVPALIAGNVVILKPSEHTPHVAEMLVGCWERAGVPAGVVQLVQGARNTGVALAEHEGVNGILFTGSVATGTALHKQAAGKLDKMLALELGGNNPLIVWDVADVQAAALLIIQSAFITTGQRCTCARRLILPKGAAGDAVLEALIAATKKLVIGAYDAKPESFMGPLVSKEAAVHALNAQQALLSLGAISLLEMRPYGAGGAFVTPAILDVTGVANVPDEEIFAPLLKVVRCANMAEALREANNTRYGLSAGICTDNSEHVQQFMQHVRAGVVAINRPTTGASGSMPFGGIGLSGNHRPSAYYAADYCAWPVASQESDKVTIPNVLLPGISL
jgi:succinylglutamic semialdehyde dehydrogenase